MHWLEDTLRSKYGANCRSSDEGLGVAFQCRIYEIPRPASLKNRYWHRRDFCVRTVRTDYIQVCPSTVLTYEILIIRIR